MNFFNKYKDLFEVPDVKNSSIQKVSQVPSTKLRLDNQLFIDKPYVEAYSQEYSLNNKLRELKKDYNEFENQVHSIHIVKKTPKRSLSRKGDDHSKILNQKNKAFTENTEKKPEKEINKQKLEYLIQKNNFLAESKKRQQWLKYEQNNILKHSQIDLVFGSKLQNLNPYKLEDIKDSPIIKPDLSSSENSYNPKQKQSFLIKSRSKPQIDNTRKEKNVQTSNKDQSAALKRREIAKGKLEERQRKLQQILRTIW